MKCKNCWIEFTVGGNGRKKFTPKTVVEYEHNVQFVDDSDTPTVNTTRSTLCPVCSSLVTGTVEGSLHGNEILTLTRAVIKQRALSSLETQVKKKHKFIVSCRRASPEVSDKSNL